MADIFGDSNTLAPHTLSSGADGTDAPVSPHTLAGGDAGALVAAPAYTIAATGSFLDFVYSDLPVHAMSVDMVTGALIELDGALPPYEIEASATLGSVILADLTLPPYILAGDFGWMAANELPAFTLDASAVSGTVVIGDMVFPAYTLSAAMEGFNLIDGAGELPAYVLSATGQTAGVGEAALLLPVHRLLAEGLTGAVLDVDETLPPYVLVAIGHGAYTLDGASTLPIWQLDAEMSSAVVAAYRAWVLNLKNLALTEYTNFAFNSFASMGGKLYGASAAGIFEIGTQAADAGTAIAATMRTGKHHFGTLYAKRVPRIYFGGSSAGDLVFCTITGDSGRREYLLPWNQSTAAQLRRVPVGRGPKATYWQFEVRNRAGADFTIDVLQLYPETSARRVSGQ